LTPPAVLLLDQPEPFLRGNTNADLLDLLLDYRAALRNANADKAALRTWAESAEE
jgi:hypothetical protein